MAEDTALSELLSQLDAIANAPLTGSQREARAGPLLESAGVTVADVGQALGQAELGWNEAKAKEYGVSPQTWLHAVRAVNLSASRTVNDLNAPGGSGRSDAGCRLCPSRRRLGTAALVAGRTGFGRRHSVEIHTLALSR